MNDAGKILDTVGLPFIIATFAAIGLLFLYLAIFFGSIFSKKGEERRTYVRDFKKGKLTIIYAVMFPFFLIGNLYEQETLELTTVLKSILISAKNSVALVTVNLDFESVDKLMDAFLPFNIAVIFGYTLVVINTLMFVFSILGQHAFSFLTWCRWNIFRKKRVMLIGNNANNRSIYRSITDKSVAVGICRSMTGEEEKELYVHNYRYFSGKRAVGMLEDELKRVFRHSKDELTVIINTESDEENLEIGMDVLEMLKQELEPYVSALQDEEKADTAKKEIVKIYNRIRICIFGSPEFGELYEPIENESQGCIHYINKYLLVASRFVEKYPLSLFMDEQQLDYDSACIRHDAGVDVAFIGFGNTNREIFLASLATNHFIQKTGDGVEERKVNYHVFSNRTPEKEISIIRNYDRYGDFLKAREEKKRSLSTEDREAFEQEYLELPGEPANVRFYDFPVDDADRTVEEIKKFPNDGSGITFFIIAKGSDMENIAMLQTLHKLQEEEGWTNIFFFVKVSGMNTEHAIFRNSNCFAIGSGTKEIYTYENIVAEETMRKARMLNQWYENLEEETEKDYGWYCVRNDIDRDSNISAVLAIRARLGMLGLDYITDEEYAGLSEEEHRRIDENVVSKEDFSKMYASARDNLANLEHLRWNAFYFSHGYIPASIKEIKADKRVSGKNHRTRHHGCLTTMSGLKKYEAIRKESGRVEEKYVEVIKYDYGLMDHLYKYMEHEGGTVFKKYMKGPVV